MCEYGRKEGQSEYILVVDDDNEIHPEYLARTVAKLEAGSPSIEVYGSEPWHAVATGRLVIHDGYTDYAPAYYQTGYGFAAIDWGWLIRKEVFDTIQYDETLWGDEDADFGIQFFKHFRALTLDEPLQTAYANSNDGVCLPSERRLKSLEMFVNKNWPEYEEAGPKDLSFLYRFAGRNHYLAGHKKTAIKYFWMAFHAWPKFRTLTHLLVSLINYQAYYNLMRIEEKYYSSKRMSKIKWLK